MLVFLVRVHFTGAWSWRSRVEFKKLSKILAFLKYFFFFIVNISAIYEDFSIVILRQGSSEKWHFGIETFLPRVKLLGRFYRRFWSLRFRTIVHREQTAAMEELTLSGQRQFVEIRSESFYAPGHKAVNLLPLLLLALATIDTHLRNDLSSSLFFLLLSLLLLYFSFIFSIFFLLLLFLQLILFFFSIFLNFFLIWRACHGVSIKQTRSRRDKINQTDKNLNDAIFFGFPERPKWQREILG